MSWSAAQYVKFEDERSRPARDLVAAIPGGVVARAVDLGCGPGNSTEILRRRFPQAEIVGVDSSPDMIAAARKRLPDVRFEIADLVGWETADPTDLILSNAALQWVPDHATLFPALLTRLTPGGCLAVQMPDNLDEPSHRLMRAVAANGPWAQILASANTARAPRHTADWYYNLLRPTAARVDVWLTIYHHPLAGGVAGVIEWLKGTGLRPYLDALGEPARTVFLARYAAELKDAYPALPDGTVLLPFPRLFIVATRR